MSKDKDKVSNNWLVLVQTNSQRTFYEFSPHSHRNDAYLSPKNCFEAKTSLFTAHNFESIPKKSRKKLHFSTDIEKSGNNCSKEWKKTNFMFEFDWRFFFVRFALYSTVYTELKDASFILHPPLHSTLKSLSKNTKIGNKKEMKKPNGFRGNGVRV